jgi:hypothetical protein
MSLPKQEEFFFVIFEVHEFRVFFEGLTGLTGLTGLVASGRVSVGGRFARE